MSRVARHVVGGMAPSSRKPLPVVAVPVGSMDGREVPDHGALPARRQGRMGLRPRGLRSPRSKAHGGPRAGPWHLARICRGQGLPPCRSEGCRAAPRLAAAGPRRRDPPACGAHREELYALVNLDVDGPERRGRLLGFASGGQISDWYGTRIETSPVRLHVSRRLLSRPSDRDVLNASGTTATAEPGLGEPQRDRDESGQDQYPPA
jgi:hypothetical protein